jgi:hypothetical protein
VLLVLYKIQVVQVDQEDLVIHLLLALEPLQLLLLQEQNPCLL